MKVEGRAKRNRESAPVKRKERETVDLITSAQADKAVDVMSLICFSLCVHANEFMCVFQSQSIDIKWAPENLCVSVCVSD